MSGPYYCSFCGASNRERVRMIAGPVNVFICDICIMDACQQMAAHATTPAYMGELEYMSWRITDLEMRGCQRG